MTIEAILLLLLLLQLKHLIVDWCWQPPYELQNKGTYGHFGGIRHAGKNAIGTALCFLPFFGVFAALIALVVDLVLHYHIDYAKMALNKAKGWSPTQHPEFWYLTGFDQFLHQVTYIGIIALVMFL